MRSEFTGSEISGSEFSRSEFSGSEFSGQKLICGNEKQCRSAALLNLALVFHCLPNATAINQTKCIFDFHCLIDATAINRRS